MCCKLNVINYYFIVFLQKMYWPIPALFYAANVR